MKVLVLFAVLLAIGVAPPAAWGRPTGNQNGSSDALRRVLEVGQEVEVTDDTGRSIRGRVVSISDDQLVIGDVFVRRWSNLWAFKPRREKRAVGVASVTRVDTVDSIWNGAAIGAAAGVGVLVPMVKSATSNTVDGSVVLVDLTMVIGGALIGGVIDSLMNKPIYERSSQTPRVLVAPMLGPGAIGVSALVGF